MTPNRFSDPEDAHDRWADVRMRDPDAGEWDVDVVVADGTVEYVDLRVRPDLLAGFVECLLDDVGDEEAARVLADIAERNDLDVGAAAGPAGDGAAAGDGDAEEPTGDEAGGAGDED